MKKVMKRVISLTLVLTLFMVTFTGCSSNNTTLDTESLQPEKKVLSMSSMANEQEKVIIENAIARFEKSNPEYTVDVNFTSGSTWGEYCDKLLIQMSSRSAPDIIEVAVEGTQMMVKNNVLIPLDDLIAKNNDEAMIDDFVPATLKTFTINDKLYELPNGCNDVVIHYNTKMFEEAGISVPDKSWTWEEFEDAAKKLTKGDGADKVWGYAVALSPAWIAGWYMANGTDFITDDWKNSNLSDPKVKETTDFLRKLIVEDKVAPVPEANLDPTSLFAAGRVAMITTGIWPFPSYKANGFEDFDVMPMAINSSDARIAYGVGGFGIVSSSKDPDGAYKLLKELISVETGKERCLGGTSIPVRYSLSTEESFLEQCPHAFMFFSELENAKALPSPENYSDLERITNSMFSIIFSEVMSTDEALQIADEELKESFAYIE
jgi:multiple sugar transport system substrate-binding protein